MIPLDNHGSSEVAGLILGGEAGGSAREPAESPFVVS